MKHIRISKSFNGKSMQDIDAAINKFLNEYKGHKISYYNEQISNSDSGGFSTKNKIYTAIITVVFSR